MPFTGVQKIELDGDYGEFSQCGVCGELFEEEGRCGNCSLIPASDQLMNMIVDAHYPCDLEALRQYLPLHVKMTPAFLVSDNMVTAISQRHMNAAVAYARTKASDKPQKDQIALAIDKLWVLLGKEILNVIPDTGRVSVEVDPRLSFSTEGSVAKALSLLQLLEEEGIPKDRVLIELVSTWEGIQAEKELESVHGVHCNMTLVYSFVQAAACAEADLSFITIPVGDIYDWHVKAFPQMMENIVGRNDDPGVVFTQQVFNYYQKFGYRTKIMAASFCNIDQIKGVNGCDVIAISPELLLDLEKDMTVVPIALSVAKAIKSEVSKIEVPKQLLRLWVTEDKKTADLLSKGILELMEEAYRLEQLVAGKF
uniref:Transaldolase n=1 Tax=Steinernema glaseri TaxID=37863 RepID=A0A1I7Y269_9BILA